MAFVWAEGTAAGTVIEAADITEIRTNIDAVKDNLANVAQKVTDDGSDYTTHNTTQYTGHDATAYSGRDSSQDTSANASADSNYYSGQNGSVLGSHYSSYCGSDNSGVYDYAFSFTNSGRDFGYNLGDDTGALGIHA